MSEGYFICQGDRTTCGGKVLGGDHRVNIFGGLHAREGDPVTCGKDGKIYRIVGGVSFIESHGRVVAGSLDSYSSCPCSARLLPSTFTACYENTAPTPQTARMAASASPPAIPPSPTSPPPFWPSFMGASNRLEPQEPGFYVVPTSMSREALIATLFPTPDAAVMQKFKALNPGLGDLKAGSMILLGDPGNFSCTRQEAELMKAAEQVKAALEPLSPKEAEFLYRHGAEIASFTGETSTWLGVSAVVMEKHLSSLRDTLLAIERLHQDSFRQYGHLKSPQFFAERQRLLAQLDAQLLNSTRLRGQTSLGDHPKLKTALGISSKSLVHHWNKAGAPGQIPGYATHISATSRAAKYMTAGGYIGIGIGGVSSLAAIQEVCRGDSGAACEKVKFTEGGKFIGSAAGGFLGSSAGELASIPICTALGVSTGIGGVICVATLIGVGAWTGTTVGSLAGEQGGELLYRTPLL